MTEAARRGSASRISLTNRLAIAGIELPSVSGPFGAYVPAKRVGNLVFVAGQLPMKGGRLLASGSVTSSCSIANATLAARQCAINALAAAATVVDLDRLVEVVRVGAFVCSDPEFSEQPLVADGASELLLALFRGASGAHARTAIGVSSLPRQAAVELECVFRTR